MTCADEHLSSLHNINKVAAFIFGFILLELSNNLFPIHFLNSTYFCGSIFPLSLTLLIYQRCQLSPHYASKHNVKYAEEYAIINAY